MDMQELKQVTVKEVHTAEGSHVHEGRLVGMMEVSIIATMEVSKVSMIATTSMIATRRIIPGKTQVCLHHAKGKVEGLVGG